ncbi:DUF488 domain-containing protein [Oceanibacterium hippocampi]|uniref:Uroporphyrin-III C-methyltransferase n=1 Tax=Oceanibacterium hippocampi TaxID=745714 RepID=A0A1Y5RWA1_9PROT|nr:DUF488 domain-containing protein [Oceanibacterium hippocampi]SLN26890.1 hypothetical protein OCH7691_00859 [Oceanibacterium hippocampi]
MSSGKSKPEIAIKRIYDGASRRDGYRVLVDRVWPRGVSKEEADIDRWAKEIAPSSKLRKWFGHDPERWDEFRKRYREELDEQTDTLRELLDDCGGKRMTLLFGAKDTEHNQAVVLKDVLKAL